MRAGKCRSPSGPVPPGKRSCDSRPMRAAVLLCLVLALVPGVVQAQTRPPAAAAPTANQIDINSASRDQLMTLDGIGEVRADAIIRMRPFKLKTELVERRVI